MDVHEAQVVSQLGSHLEARVAQVAGVRTVAAVVAHVIAQSTFRSEALVAYGACVLLLVCHVRTNVIIHSRGRSKIKHNIA